MTTIEKAAIYSSMLKHYYGVGPDEALELAAVLDDMIAATDKYRKLLKYTLRTMYDLRELIDDRQSAFSYLSDGIDNEIALLLRTERIAEDKQA
jgi:hypothetical protein